MEDLAEFARLDDDSYCITGDMLIGDVLAAFPKVAGIMLGYGLHCVGCHANLFDTIESGARGHGMDDIEIQMMMDEINVAVNKRIETIEFTPRAIMKVKEFRSQEIGKEQWPLRMKMLLENDSASSGYELDFDLRAETDLHFEFDGLEIIIDPKSYEYFRGSSVDFVDTPDGGGFKIDNPNKLPC